MFIPITVELCLSICSLVMRFQRDIKLVERSNRAALESVHLADSLLNERGNLLLLGVSEHIGTIMVREPISSSFYLP
jgi:hypothetical protein